MKSSSFLIYFISIAIALYFSGCSSSSETEERTETTNEESKQRPEIEYPGNSAILNIAKAEQDNKMYSPEADSTYLYWLDSQLVILNGFTKCNIFALNVLYKSGFKTPEENALAQDLFDTAYYTEILPVIGINEMSNAKAGDLVVLNNHVMIFESYLIINDEEYAIGWWAGSNQQDNYDNIKNNVCYGKYKLEREYVVRRPVKNDS